MNNEIQQQCTSPVRNRGVKAPTFKRGFSQLFAKFASVLTSCGLTTMLMPLVLAGSGLIAIDTAAANNKCAMANPNSKGDHVSEICWLQLDGVSFTANGSTPLTFDLPDGSTMQVNVVVSGSSGGGLSAAQAPSWSGSQFSGSTGYYTIYTPNRAVLYTPGTSANTTSVKLENIRLFTPNGSLVDHAYELIMADGESSNTGENLDFGVQSGGSELSLLEWLGASPSNNLSIEAHKGSATACGGFGAIDCRRLVGKADTANAAVFTTTRVPGASPFTVVGQVRTSGTNKQGFAFGLRWGGVKLRKQIAGLLDTADRFRYETINIKGSQMDTATSAAGASGALSYVTAQAVMPGNTITLKESMAGGSSTLAQYDKTISCTNTNVGSSTPLPTGAYEPSSPPTIDLQNKGDNVACTITNTPRIVDLAITKSAPPTVEAGKPFDYVLKIENIGTHAATAATYLDTLPTEFADLVAGAVTCRVVLGGALCGTNHVASGKTASGSIASLPPGAAVEIVIKVTAPAIKKSVTNTATVSLATTDTTVGEPTTKRANNTANATTQILSPVLALTKTASPASFVEGVEGSYTLTVTNTGDLATTGSIEVVDVLPVGLTAGVMPSECASVGGTVTCTYIGVLAPGGTKQWTIPVTADVSLVGTSVTNTAAVSGGGSSCTSSAACNSNTVTTPVVGAPKLSIAKSHVGDFIPGVAGIYTLTVSNNGTAATSGMVTVTDTLPTGLSFVSASGAGWACSAAGLTVTCTQSAAIAVGGSAPSIALTVAVALGTANRVTNTANVGGGGDTACPAASRCTTTDITTVNTAASFTVAKHAAVADTNGNT
ncbi:hypothetical protein, partial [Stenotrophomonas sp.]|uniref:hypothetical protein n=1 Tax=Stenotrophomonas sp. TaxID=69392 RepID=UPI0028AC5AEB